MDFLGICILIFMGGVVVGLTVCLCGKFSEDKLILLILGLLLGILAAGFILSACEYHNFGFLFIGEAFAIGAIVLAGCLPKRPKLKLRKERGENGD